MPNKQQQWVLSVRVVLETEPRNRQATEAYAKRALKSAFQGLKNANSALAIYDENDVQVGRDETGNPSEEMRRLMDYEFGDDEGPPTQVAGL